MYTATSQPPLNLRLPAPHMTCAAYQIFQGNILIHNSQHRFAFQNNEQVQQIVSELFVLGTVAPGSVNHTSLSISVLCLM